MSHIRSQAHGTLISLPVSYPCVYIVSMNKQGNANPIVSVIVSTN